MTGAELKVWRLRKGLSQAALGRLLHVTVTTVYRWENPKEDDAPIPELAALVLKFMPAGTIAQQRTKRRA